MKLRLRRHGEEDSSRRPTKSTSLEICACLRKMVYEASLAAHVLSGIILHFIDYCVTNMAGLTNLGGRRSDMAQEMIAGPGRKLLWHGFMAALIR